MSNLAPFQIDGVTYTRRNRVQLDNMVASTAFHDLLATSCTTGVDNFAELFGDVSQAKVPNQANFNPAGDDGAVGPPRHDVHGSGPPVVGHARGSETRSDRVPARLVVFLLKPTYSAPSEQPVQPSQSL